MPIDTAKMCAVTCHLGPTIVFNGCHIKALTPFAQKSDRSDAELGEHYQLYTLRFGKCS